MPHSFTRARLPPGQAGIQRFTRASKPGTSLAEGKPALPPSTPKKRKLSEIGSSEGVEMRQDTFAAPVTPSKTLRLSDLTVSTPRSIRTRSVASQTQCSEFPTPSSDETSTPTSSPSPAQTQDHYRFRNYLKSNDLLGLHSSFLTALSLHIAHNGTTISADLRQFLPAIGRIWKKRKVVISDLQRLIWIWESNPDTVSRFRIANYGLGKVCLERLVCKSSESRENVNRFDEDGLQKQFERNLERIWRQVVDSNDTKGKEINLLEHLGLASIHESLTPFTALRKGQQRLQDLKGSVIKVKTAKFKENAENNSTSALREAATDRRQGLLERIKGKTLRQTKLPLPPSKEALMHQSAAERVEEVARVLSLLKPSGSVGNGPWARVALQRKPFQFETIVRNIQDSMRSPISDKEAAVCLEILAQPGIAGDWVNIVTINQLKSVVLTSGGKASAREIGARVAAMKIGYGDHS